MDLLLQCRHNIGTAAKHIDQSETKDGLYIAVHHSSQPKFFSQSGG